MALKISEMNALSSVALDDALVIVDTSAGVTKQVPVSGLFKTDDDIEFTQNLLMADGKYIGQAAGPQIIFDDDIEFTQNLLMADGKYIGQAAGPQIIFDDTNNYFEFTGANNFTMDSVNGKGIFIGKDAGAGISMTDSAKMVVIGHEARNNGTSGQSDVIIGYQAAQNLCSNPPAATGTECIVIGYQALYTGGYARDNVMLGYQAGYSITTGRDNVAIGLQACWRCQTGSNNVEIGNEVAKGSGVDSHSNSVMIGKSAGEDITSGSNNILIGYQAGDNLTTGGNNIIIGYDIDASDVAVTHELNIGDAITGDLSTGDIAFAGNILMADGKYIGQAAGPQVLFDDTNNHLEITGCDILVGTTASATDFPNAKNIFSHSDGGQTDSDNIGAVGEAAADGTYDACGLWGCGKTSGARRGIGVLGKGYVSNNADTGDAVGGAFYSTTLHNYDNIAVYASALNASGSGKNYSFYGDDGILHNDGDASIGGEIEIDGDLNHDGTNVGFFGTAPVSQRLKADYNNWANLGDVVNALVALGLFDQA